MNVSTSIKGNVKRTGPPEEAHDHKQKSIPQKRQKIVFSEPEEVYNYVIKKLSDGWSMEASKDASVCALICFRRMMIPKDVQSYILRYVRHGATLAHYLTKLLKDVWRLCDLVVKDVDLLDKLCEAMHLVDLDDGLLTLGQLLQHVVKYDSIADEEASRQTSNEDPIRCFRAARWYAKNGHIPPMYVRAHVWECWMSFDPVIPSRLPWPNYAFLMRGCKLSVFKKLIESPWVDPDNYLHAAFDIGNMEFARLCIENGASLWKKRHDLSPLERAVSAGSIALVKIFLDNGASLDSEEGHRCLIKAIKSQDERMVNLLLQCKINLNTKYRFNAPVLFCAKDGNDAILRMLIAHGADVNTLGGKGLPPIRHAMRKNGTEMMKTLIKHGANLNLVDQDGMTPLEYAKCWELDDCIDILKQHVRNE